MRWRTGRHRHPLWKSLVLPAGGVALCWLLLMTLWLPLLDYARSYRALVQRIAQHVPRGACVAAPRHAARAVAALEYHGGWRVDARHDRRRPRCDFLVLRHGRAAAPAAPRACRSGWRRDRRASSAAAPTRD